MAEAVKLPKDVTVGEWLSVNGILLFYYLFSQ